MFTECDWVGDDVYLWRTSSIQLSLISTPSFGYADTYPSRPLTIINPSPPGGYVDNLAHNPNDPNANGCAHTQAPPPEKPHKTTIWVIKNQPKAVGIDSWFWAIFGLLKQPLKLRRFWHCHFINFEKGTCRSIKLSDKICDVGCTPIIRIINNSIV